MWRKSNSETDKQEIQDKFYEKEMVSRLVLMERSALPIKIKIQIMALEVVRRLRNTHSKERKEEIYKVLSKFMAKLKLRNLKTVSTL